MAQFSTGVDTIVLKDKKGSGKSLVGDVIGRLISRQHHTVVKSSAHILGQFNGHSADAVLVQVEEALWAPDKKGGGQLKSLITEPFMTMERKGVDAVSAPSFVRVLMTSNENFIVPATEDERRFFVLQLLNENIGGAVPGGIFGELQAGGYGRLMWELLDTDLSMFDAECCAFSDESGVAAAVGGGTDPDRAPRRAALPYFHL